MENTPPQALIPFKQDMIPFYGNEVLGVRLPADRIAATIHSLCAMFGILPHGQIQRIRRDRDLAEYLLRALVETSGGLQVMDVLNSRKIPDWVMGLQLKRIAPEKRPLVLALQTEAVAFFYRHFFSEQPATTPESQAAPSQPAHDKADAAPVAAWDRLFEGLHIIWDALHEIRQEERAKAGRVEVVEEWLLSLDRRVAATGQGGAVESGWLPMLSPAHLADLRMLLRSLEQTTGRTQAQLEQELVETFRVPAINAILDELWQDVLDWGLWRGQQAK